MSLTTLHTILGLLLLIVIVKQYNVKKPVQPQNQAAPQAKLAAQQAELAAQAAMNTKKVNTTTAVTIGTMITEENSPFIAQHPTTPPVTITHDLEQNQHDSSEDIMIMHPSTVKIMQCHGKNIHILGDKSMITLTDDCPIITVSGPDSKIYANAVQQINIYGPNSKVYYKRSIDPNRSVQIKAIGPNSAVQRY